MEVIALVVSILALSGQLLLSVTRLVKIAIERRSDRHPESKAVTSVINFICSG